MSDSTIRISSLVISNLNSFNRICGLVRDQKQPSILARSHRARFALWAGSLAAHRRSGTRSLEYRLRDASTIKNHIINLLKDLEVLLLQDTLPLVRKEQDEKKASDEAASMESKQSYTEVFAFFESDSEEESNSPAEARDGELTQLLSHIGGVIDCLLRLSTTIRNPAPHDHFRSRVGANLHMSIEPPFYEPYVRGEYPQVAPHLSERLARGLARRRDYLNYREEHHNRLEAGLEGNSDDGTSTERPTTIASSIPWQFKDGHEEQDDQSVTSTTSYVTSYAEQSDKRVPPLPKEHVDGPFLCPYCKVVIVMNTRHEWRHHVFCDLQPYICMADTCVTPDLDYERRQDWMRHMWHEHWREWFCPFGCNGQYSSSQQLQTHLNDRHQSSITEVSISEIVRLSSKANAELAKGPCPICHGFDIRSPRQYQSHIANHLQRLALIVLPAQEDDDDLETSDSESALSQTQTSEDDDDEVEGPEEVHTVVCFSCRELRLWCENDGDTSPCEACIKQGKDCKYPTFQGDAGARAPLSVFKNWPKSHETIAVSSSHTQSQPQTRATELPHVDPSLKAQEEHPRKRLNLKERSSANKLGPCFKWREADRHEVNSKYKTTLIMWNCCRCGAIGWNRITTPACLSCGHEMC